MRPLHPSAVPPEMIELATERRLAGDWRGACAAANVDVHVDLDLAGTAGPAEADLLHLAPDLLRWYLPRDKRSGYFEPAAHYRLGRWLTVSTPAALRDPQRLTLRLGTTGLGSGARRKSLPRYCWDFRCTAEILDQCGGADRLPFFTRAGERLTSAETAAERAIELDEAGRHVEAWSVAGFTLDSQILDDGRWGNYIFQIPPGDVARRRRAPDSNLRWQWPPHTRVPTLIRRHLAELGRSADLVKVPRNSVTLVIDVERPLARLIPKRTGSEDWDRRRRAEREEFGVELPDVPSIPAELLRRPELFEALRSGRLAPDDLHPIVHGVLFPQRHGPGPRPRDQLSLSVGVRCLGANHKVRMVDGRMVCPHTEEELARERVLAGLGGARLGCLDVYDGWRAPGTAALPEQLRRLRDRLAVMLVHGDRWGVEEELRRGLDPGFRTEDGRAIADFLS
ncbi:hypothetical protein [Dactylosporangium salmoneum]|uniref:Uncharacterized protein n=1 Tax=Dactylosporangium salmoneum TaxID=53361 RepID=A0ABN3GNF3_9ACTN